MSQYKHKMVDGQLVELTEDEIAELEQRDKDNPPEPPPEPKEPEHAKRKSK